MKFPPDLLEYFCVQDLHLSELCRKFTLWPDAICCFSFQTVALAACAGINIPVSIELTFSSSQFLDLSSEVGPRQPLMHFIYVAVPADPKVYCLNTEFMYFT